MEANRLSDKNLRKWKHRSKSRWDDESQSGETISGYSRVRFVHVYGFFQRTRNSDQTSNYIKWIKFFAYPIWLYGKYKKVFPELREWCFARNMDLIECDLRWGVPSDSTTDQTITTCLSELDRCHEDNNDQPFFIGMLSEKSIFFK